MPLIRTPSDWVDPVEQPIEDLAAALADADMDRRWSAVRAAAERKDCVPNLAQALARETDARIREAIFTALAQIGSSESIFAILPHLRSDDAGLRTGAMDALRVAPDLTKQNLPHLLADPDPDVRLLSCDLARIVNDDEARRLLCELIEAEPEANVCAAAIEVLAEIGDANAAHALARCASRFPDNPFLTFSVNATLARLGRRDT